MMPGVGFMVGVVGLGSDNPEFKSHLAVELIRGGVDSACYPSEVSKITQCWSTVLEWGPVQDCVQQPRRLLRQHQCSAQSAVPMMDG